MRYLFPSALFLGLSGLLFAQGNYYSLGGYGNVVYPGTGHAPVTPPGGINGPHFFGAPGAGNRGFRGPGPGPVGHPQHQRTTVVYYPYYYGGYGNGGDAYYGDQPQQPPVDPNGAPSVVINQGFVPPQSNPVVREYTPDTPPEPSSGLRVYQNPSHPYADRDADANSAPPRRSADDDEPTLYLIAFKDHSIVQALGYWMEQGALHYVSVEHALNQASLDLIDRDLSQRLNDERGVPFKLPVR